MASPRVKVASICVSAYFSMTPAALTASSTSPTVVI